jgi:hypothetical protein
MQTTKLFCTAYLPEHHCAKLGVWAEPQTRHDAAWNEVRVNFELPGSLGFEGAKDYVCRQIIPLGASIKRIECKAEHKEVWL